MLNIEGGTNDIVTLGTAVKFEENGIKDEITFGAPKVVPTFSAPQRTILAPKVKKVSYLPTFVKGCVKAH
jgi:hypothetical protein